METLIGFIVLIVSIGLIIAVFNISSNTKRTNHLLRFMLNEQNPERFKLTTLGKIKDKESGNKV